ncbi:retinol dehydrogenase 16-like [Amphiura filiformis]|uniref:retinol dehydrogenase 16-like n=1 Tax=Amphiura filiformis TaxID=82378 RepID=UPI003B213D13
MLLFIALTIAAICLTFWILDKFKINPKDRYILITGCDTGIGNTLAKSLDKKGCYVFATCLTSEGAESLQKVSSDRLYAINMDITNSDSIKTAFDTVEKIMLEKNATLWGLVNNAGVPGYPGFYDWWPREVYRRIIDVNLLGPIEVTNVFLPLIRSKGKGRIVNASSGVALTPFSCSGYSMSKCALEAFSDCLRHQLCYTYISVHMIEPTYFLTHMTDATMKSDKIEMSWNQMTQSQRDYYGRSCIDQIIELTKQEQQVSDPNLHLVSDAMEHALFGWFPWRRYPIGGLVKYVARPASVLPAFIVDYLRRVIVPLPKPQGCH